ATLQGTTARRREQDAAVPVEEQGRVDTLKGNGDGSGPRAWWIGGGEDEVAAGRDVGRRREEDTSMMAGRRRVYSSRIRGTCERQLARARQTMADLRPMHEIAAVKQRDSRKVFEAAGDQVVVFAHATNARVRIEARQHGISVHRRHESDAFIPPVG